MPIYEYRCDNCGMTTEIIQKISDQPLTKCKKCSKQLRKQISPPAIIFKGSGWYVTDYPTKDRKEGLKKENGDVNKKKETSSKASNTKNANTTKTDS